jgi:hypothetical protein
MSVTLPSRYRERYRERYRYLKLYRLRILYRYSDHVQDFTIIMIMNVTKAMTMIIFMNATDLGHSQGHGNGNGNVHGNGNGNAHGSVTPRHASVRPRHANVRPRHATVTSP